MTSGKITKPFELSEIFMFGTRITDAGEKLTLENKYQEGDSIYCYLSSKAGGSNFEMMAIVECSGNKYLILTSTPDVSIDDPCITGLVLKLVSQDTAVTILAEELDHISESCMTIVDLSRNERIQTILDHFGALKSE